MFLLRTQNLTVIASQPIKATDDAMQSNVQPIYLWLVHTIILLLQANVIKQSAATAAQAILYVKKDSLVLIA